MPNAAVDPSLDLSTEPALDLLSFINASPSPYAVCETVATRLTERGFTAQPLDEPFAGSGSWFTIVGGSLIAWIEPDNVDPAAPFTIIGAHTDSPNLRIKPLPDDGSAGFRQVGVETYGGVLLNSWLDRDLGISGRVDLADGTAHTVVINEPVLRVPQLAIHLDREIRDRGLNLNAQQHMRPVWGLGTPETGEFAAWVAATAGLDAPIVAWDLMTHDLTPGAIVGADQSMIASARLDNQVSCWAAIETLRTAAPADRRTLVCLFDHEEVGSTSATGAGSAMLPSILERIVADAGGDRSMFHLSMARSTCVSADGAHATHPNYADRHDPGHHISLNGGPVVKINANERYATTAHTHAAFATACADAGIPLQRFVSRSDMPCGSTIGPVTAANLGIATIDVGMAQLGMHSARECAGSLDPDLFVRALSAYVQR